MKHEAGKNHALQQQVAGLVAEVSSIKRSRTWVWVGGVTAIGSALAALGTLFFSMAQLAPPLRSGRVSPSTDSSASAHI